MLPNTFSRGGLPLSPPACLLAALIGSILMAGLSGYYAASAALLLGIGCLLLARIPWAILRPRLITVNVFVVFMWLFVPFTMSLDSLGQFSPAGARLCLLITLKANAIICIFTAFLSRMSPYALGAALSALLCPPKLVWLFLLLDRNIHILRQEWTIIMASAKLRGFAPRATIKSYRNMAALLALWLYRAWEKAQTLHGALLLRGYNGQAHFPPCLWGASSWLLLPLLLLFLPLLYLDATLP